MKRSLLIRSTIAGWAEESAGNLPAQSSLPSMLAGGLLSSLSYYVEINVGGAKHVSTDTTISRNRSGKSLMCNSVAPLPLSYLTGKLARVHVARKGKVTVSVRACRIQCCSKT